MSDSQGMDVGEILAILALLFPIVFAVFKLAGFHLSWWWVLLPLWIALVPYVLLVVAGTLLFLLPLHHFGLLVGFFISMLLFLAYLAGVYLFVKIEEKCLSVE